MDTMQDWFGLKDGHNDFMIETDGDARLFFARKELDKDLHGRLRRAFRTENPPKLVLYGDWGVGKTHTMRHMEHVIETTNDFQAMVVFVELPDITAKSTFQVAHAALLDALGFERAKRWVLHFQTQHQSDAQEQIREFTQSGDIATAFANVLGFGEASRIAWDWLRGLSLSASDARLAGLPPALTQSNHLVKVLEMMGRLAREAEDKLLVFMLDEATKLGNVTNSDAVNHWLNAFKLLADQQAKDIGFILSGSWIDTDDMALPLQDMQVMSRFGESNYIQLHNLDEVATEEFIRALLAEWIEPSARDKLIAEHGAEADGESLDDSTFPFTKEGLSLAASYACRLSGFVSPRDIQKTVDDLLNRAIDENRHIASEAYLSSVVHS
jgi:GTPase SAR1 family protein